MKKDLNKNTDSFHPSDAMLAEYIEDTLNSKKKSEIVRHLIECDECSDVLALMKKYRVEEISPQVKPLNQMTIVNNWWLSKRVKGVVLGGVVASFVVMFINLKNENIELGLIDLSKPSSYPSYKGATDMKFVNKIIDADKVLASIISLTDVSHLKSFSEAQKEKNFKTAKGLYSQAIIEATMELDIKKSLQQKIVIHERLLKLSIENKKEEEIEDYKNILRYEVRLYSTKFK